MELDQQETARNLAKAMADNATEKELRRLYEETMYQQFISMDKNELSELIKASKIIFESKGGVKKPLKEERKTIAFAFASIASLKDIKKGDKFTNINIFPIRPGNGYYKVKDFTKLLKYRANKNIKRGEQIKPSDVKKN